MSPKLFIILSVIVAAAILSVLIAAGVSERQIGALEQQLAEAKAQLSEAKVRQEWMGGYMVEVLKACRTNDVTVPRNFSTNWGLNIRTTGEVAVIHYE